MIRLTFRSDIVFNFAGAVGLAILCAAPARPATSGTTPDAQLLERVGERVKELWDHLSSVSSTEEVLQEKLDPKGKVILNNRTSYDYLISLHWDNGGMLVDESRLAVGTPRRKAPQGVLLTTQGFAGLVMVFHPQFQPSYAFSMLGEEQIGGRTVTRVGFLSRNGAPTPSVLAVKGRDYPIEWEGTAWIDPATYTIARIETRWKEPAPELGVKSLSSEVQYAPVAFRGKEEKFWLPESAKVDVETLHQHWRNTHHFSNHRLFNVETDSVIGDAPIAKPDEPRKGDQR